MERDNTLIAIGAGGVMFKALGDHHANPVFSRVIVADYNFDAARRVVDAGYGTNAVQLDCRKPAELAQLLKAYPPHLVWNGCAPGLAPNIHTACLEAGVSTIDMAMTPSARPRDPPALPEVVLGDTLFAQDAAWKEIQKTALTGMGIDPGIIELMMAYLAADRYSTVREAHIYDASNISFEGINDPFVPSFNRRTALQECTAQPYRIEDGKLVTTVPFSHKQEVRYPNPIGLLEAINVEREEMVAFAKWLANKLFAGHPLNDIQTATFSYGLGSRAISWLKEQWSAGRCSEAPDTSGMSPLDRLADTLPDPVKNAQLETLGSTFVGGRLIGVGRRGESLDQCIYHMMANTETEKGAVLRQTAGGLYAATRALADGVHLPDGVQTSLGFGVEGGKQVLQIYQDVCGKFGTCPVSEKNGVVYLG